jgi:hypothetical protein
MDRSYIFKHWGCTILLFLISRPIQRLLKGVSPAIVFEELRMIYAYMMIGLIGASIPTLFANIVAFRLLYYYRVNIKWVKPILISLTVISICLTSYLILRTIHLESLLPYSFIAIVCGLIFKVEKK